MHKHTEILGITDNAIFSGPDVGSKLSKETAILRRVKSSRKRNVKRRDLFCYWEIIMFPRAV